MNTYYAKQIDENGDIVALHRFGGDEFPLNPYFIEITESEYNALLEEMTPPEPQPTDEISDSEALAIMLGEVTE